MKVLLLLGLVAIALADLTRFEGEKVFRLKPTLDDHVTLIKELSDSMEVDFWRPESPELVTIDVDVDIHVDAIHADMVHTLLQQSGMEHEVLIEDLQSAVEGQIDNQPEPRSHSYTKYNTLDKIQSWIASISSSNDALISKQVIGNSYEGRPMTVLKIGKQTGATKDAIFLDCGIHAREWISTAFCQWFVKEALSTYGSDAQMTSLLNEMDVFVLLSSTLTATTTPTRATECGGRLVPGILAGALPEPPATPAVIPSAATSPSLRSRSRTLPTSSAGTSPSSRVTSPSTPTPSCCCSLTPTPSTR